MAALALELGARRIPFQCQRPVPIRYKGLVLEQGLRLDLVVDEQLIVELKTVERLTDIHRAQLLTYLRLTGCPIGLLMNFNVPRLKDGIRRYVLAAPDAAPPK